jgi:putative heme iron utilization protein
MTPRELGREARQLVRQHHSGALATLSLRLQGWPFGSTVHFFTDHDGSPITLISQLAEHTRNLSADSRASLLIQIQADDPLAVGRITLIGHLRPLNDRVQARARWARHFPQHAQLLDMPDFSPHRMQIEAVRFIGGFGKIHWISPEDYDAPPNRLGEAETGIIEHMNSEHADALATYAAHLHQHTQPTPRMCGLDCDGFTLEADGQLLRIEFPHPVHHAGEARQALIDLLGRLRTPHHE